MTLIAGLGAGMSLVAVIASFHLRAVRAGGKGIMLDVAMAIDAQDLFLSMQLMRDLHYPHVLQVGLFSLRDRLVAPEAVVIHQVVTRRELVGDNLPGIGMAIRAGNRCRVHAGGEPLFWWILMAVAAQTENRVGRGKSDQPQARDSCQDQKECNDKRPGALG